MHAMRSHILFTMLLSAIFIAACENDEKKIEEWTKDVVMKEEASKVEAYLSQDGKMRARLTAPLMYRFSKDTLITEFPNTLHVDFYNDSLQKESKLDCRYGKYFESLNKVYLRDSVVVINTKGDTLKCQDLWWDQNTKLFYSDKYAEYRTNDKKIYPGKGLEATQDFSRVTFKEVTGKLKVKEGGFPE
ncbi:MAG: LPS export ABC transporter periplasmic protein LptC [Chitinophagaceae bacterium]|nr:LPS export ABC transporter periplasmic protein LptC [Chitinophagaceae bacterium]